MTARLPERLFKSCDPLPPRLSEELSAIASGEHAAVARVLDMTGKLVGLTEARTADQEFIAALLVPVDDPVELDRDAAIEVLTLVMSGDLTASDMTRAIDALEATLGPVTDLIFYPPDDRDLSAAEIYATASAIASPAPALSATSLRAARHALAEMVLAREIELPYGELAARVLARRIDHGVSASAIAEWSMSEENHLGEVFAADAVLLARIESALLKLGRDSQSRSPMDRGR